MERLDAMRRRRGATAVGYGLLVGLLALATIGAIAVTGENVAEVFALGANRISADNPGGNSGDGGNGGTVTPPPPPAPANLVLAAPGHDGIAILATAVPSSTTLAVTASNTGGTATATLSTGVSGAGFSIEDDLCSGTALAPAATCTLTLRAAASANGALDGTLTVGSASLALSGTASGFDPALVLPSDDPLTVAAITGGATTGACTGFTLTNAGIAAADSVDIALSGSDAAQFQPCSAGGTACSSSLAAGSDCSFGYRLQASANGSFAATVTVSASGQAPLTRGLAGSASGFDPLLSIGSGSFAVASITGGASQGDCTGLTVTNSGSGAGLGGASLGLTGADAASFQSCTASGTACSAQALAPGASCVLGLRLATTSAGTFNATATVTAGSQSASRPVTASSTGAYTVPGGTSFSHSPRARTISVAWSGGAGIDQCVLQHGNGADWVSFASPVSCTAFTGTRTLSGLPANWGGRTVRLAAGNGAQPLLTLGTLGCTPTTAGTAANSLDEDCDGSFDETDSAVFTSAGHGIWGSGYVQCSPTCGGVVRGNCYFNLLGSFENNGSQAYDANENPPSSYEEWARCDAAVN